MQSLLPAGLGRVTTLAPHWVAAPQNHHCSSFPLEQPFPLAPFTLAGCRGTGSAPGENGPTAALRHSAVGKASRRAGDALFRRASDALNPDMAR